MIVTILSNRGSRSAHNLAASLGAVLPNVRIGRATADSTRRCNTTRYCINLGVGTAPVEFRQRELIYTNTPLAVQKCANKLLTFDMLNAEDVPQLQYTTASVPAPLLQWLEQDGKVVARMTTTGHSGAGIVIVRRGQAVPAAPLYTRYFRKDAEYRVHVAFGEAILIQQKRKRDGVAQEGEQALIRTHANGWVFTVNDLSCDARNYRQSLVDCALRATNAVGASHCAVDILVRHRTAQAVPTVDNMVVCEINSCPALQANSTLEAYTQAFANKIRSLM